MNEELRNLLEQIFVKCRAADRPTQTILSLHKREGELLLAAFKVRVVFDYPTEASTMPQPQRLTTNE